MVRVASLFSQLAPLEIMSYGMEERGLLPAPGSGILRAILRTGGSRQYRSREDRQ